MATNATGLGLREGTCAIYKQGHEKPVSRWSFFVRVHDDNVENLQEFVERLKVTCGIKERSEELGVFRSRIKLSLRRTEPDVENPKGRIFAMDTQDQYNNMVPLLRQTTDYELIGIFKIMMVICSKIVPRF